MGNKAHPKSLQLLVTKDWENVWFSTKDYPKYIMEDIKIRKYIDKNIKDASISEIKIRRRSGKIDVDIKAAKSGVIIGTNGEKVSEYRKQLSEMIGGPVSINVIPEKMPEKRAALLAENICNQLLRRFPFRRAMKSAVQWAMKSGALGIKVQCAGRLGGVEIARTEWYLEGNVPRNTYRADIDYHFAEALTTYGIIGVKVWVYSGQRFSNEPAAKQAANDVGEA